MNKNQQNNANNLNLQRRKLKLSPLYVAHLLGHHDTAVWSDYESGKHLPSLVNALRLGIILRTPVEFLFHRLHDELWHEIRAEEERMAGVQQPLF